MANRKVLINRHTSGSSAPQADSMYLGEIAVAHETGKETLWTKNNANEMIPFISCAQTISIIDGKITGSEDSVVAKEGEPHIVVESAGTTAATVWQISSKDVQSEEEFKAYSANTKTRIDNNYSAITAVTDAFNGLLDITLTAGTGDDIITVLTASTGPSANTFSVTHRQALATNGFNKLDTDTYGHVTAATPVATADIQALGFKTSAETGEDLAELSGAVIANETHIGELSAGTIHDIETLSGDVVEYVKVVSGNVETVINELSAGTIQLSADTEAAIEAAIQALDSATAVTEGKYITGIAIADGKISGITEEDLPTLEVESAGTGNVVSQITVDGHKITYQTASVATSEGIAELSASVITNKSNIEALSAGTLHDIEVLSGAVKANETNITTVSGDVIELSAATVAIETGLGNLSAVTLTGVSLNNTPLTVTDHAVSVPVTVSGSGIANATDSGSVADAKAVKEYVQDVLSSSVDYKGATNSEPSNPAKGDLWIAGEQFTIDGKTVEVGDFIIYNGNDWDVIEKNLDGAITGTLTQGTVTLGAGVNNVESLANGSNGQVLTMVEGAPAWADDPELTVVSAGTGNVLTDITVDDHEIAFTKGITAASDADVKALSGVVEEFSATTNAKFTELSAYTKDVDDKVKALSAGTIQLSADTKAAIEQLSGFAHNSMIARDDAVFSSAKTYTDEKVAAEIALLDSSTAVTAGKYITGIAIADGKISGITEESLPANVPISATTAAPVDTPSAVLTGVTADGTDNHNLTFGMSNKVFSAATSDSALTSESALTAVHADAATKVDSALTVNFATATGSTAYTFDGSQDVTVNISDSATTEEGHYTPATAASTEVAAAGTFISAITLDSKKHVIGIGTADKVNSASTSESADTASKVANALSISGYATSESTALDTTINYDGSQAKSLTFGTNTAAGKSMSMTSAGVVDVEIIDCGEY